ncbi:glycolipid 2-alpha-mannosyltransferase-domain-containing protein [Multifurca ochricompacta]|uniref:Glycolipid 2-alpha-mannosyltransferase-domain-containing protein n=1 Tax=Multifurca ochricompacta TaxID=376703 RepID=A0AAD4MCB4_9AGAM|nr:glycolipid 2-alpha-mannosyltransferase-domain-containing protein [Multifurca ochricompacta]
MLALALPSRSLARKFFPIPNSSNTDHLERPWLSPNGGPLVNATFVVLCRNSELAGILRSVQQMEDRFNRRYGYPWVFLNDEPFTQEFQERVSIQIGAPVSFGTIPHEHWVQPEWIDEEKVTEARKRMGMDTEHPVPYGGMRSFCFRFVSSFFRFRRNVTSQGASSELCHFHRGW